MGLPGFMVLFVYVVTFVVKIRHPGYQPLPPLILSLSGRTWPIFAKKQKM